MINISEVVETNNMIEKENLDVRTITLGISLLDCIDSDLNALNDKIYKKIYEAAKDLVKTGEEISGEFGIPIVNKRISVTPIALIGSTRSGRKLYRRLFRTGKQGHDTGGRTAYPFHSFGTFHNGKSVQLRKLRFHQDRYQHGCGSPDGPDD